MLPHRPKGNTHFLKFFGDLATNVAKSVAKQHLVILLPDLESSDPGDIEAFLDLTPRHKKMEI